MSTTTTAEQREYDEFLRRKVEIARTQKAAGLHYSSEEVEAEAAVRVAEMLRAAGQAEV